ncbi:activator-dependent family glycosyltransferase [Streptomyces sp. NPDC001118]
MRILFTTFAARTHLHTQIPVAWALRTAGHDVYIASQPDLVEDITAAGLTAVPVGEPLDLHGQMGGENLAVEEIAQMDKATLEALDHIYLELADMSNLRPEQMTYEEAHARFLAMVWVFQTLCGDAMVDDLVKFAAHWKPDLVIWDTMTFAGPVAAMACGAAHARLLFGMDILAHLREAYNGLLADRPAQLRDDPLEEWVGSVLDRYGLPFRDEALVGQWTVDPVPSSLRLPVDLPYVPVRYIPYNGPSEIPAWVRETPKKRRVCLSLGVAFRETMGGNRASIGALLDAVADLDIEVVATLNASQLGSLDTVPGNVRVADFVPLDALLPTCSAIINHGGSGTFQTSLVHGVPQVIVPDMRWDTPSKAQRLEEAGAGLRIRDVDALTPGELRANLVRVLDEPSFARNAQRLRTEMLATPAPSDIVPVLEELTAHHRVR